MLAVQPGPEFAVNAVGVAFRSWGSCREIGSCCVSAAPTHVQQGEAAAHDSGHAGPRPPGPLALMERRYEQGHRERNAPECDADLENSSGVAGKRLGFLGSHTGKPMCQVNTGAPPTPYA